MTVSQPTAGIAEFTEWLAALAARIRPDAGWYAVFAERDPDGLRACFEGAELLPWDVAESLLQDAGEAPGGPLAAQGRERYAAAARAYDLRPGAADALAARRDLMEEERRHAEARVRELDARLHAHPAPGPDEAARLAHDLAWTRDDHARATARIADLTERLHRLRDGGTERPTPAPGAARRPRGARYAWAAEEAAPPGPVTVPELPTGATAPRGARFGGGSPDSASASARPSAPSRPSAPAAAPEADDRARSAANAVHALRRLRAQGRSGEAHALLCEALGGPAERLPAFADALHRAGLAADWSTLLWEAASLSPGRLAAVAGALADAGRDADCDQLLRQGVARPVGELAGAVAALRAEGRHREAHALLTAFVRARTPEDAARLAAADPPGLVPQLRAAALAVSPARERDLRHALRVAGLAGS